MLRLVHSPKRLRAALASGSSDEARVLQTAQIDALDITILEGGGDAVGQWATRNGFFLTPDSPEVLDFYADRSPIFMAAKFDASRAASLGQRRGDGTPIMLTIPTSEPWVPLRILSLGLGKSTIVEADVFVLTPNEPDLLAGGRGLSLTRSQRASAALLTDLRSDKGMEWIPDKMWLSYIQVNSAAGDLDYDLAISETRGDLPSPARAGIDDASEFVRVRDSARANAWPVVAGVALAVAAGIVGLRLRRPTAAIAP